MMGQQTRTESLFYYFRWRTKFLRITYSDSSTSISI